jgi:DNA-binding transcriptional regulator YhcF (GntR family)
VLEFYLNSRSGVPAYLQLVRQVEHATRLGFLTEGEQLPSVREVSAALVINPNTVLKAYRELEHRGLAEARAGQGMFVTEVPKGLPVREVAALRREGTAWVRRVYAAGLGPDGLEALVVLIERDLDAEGAA